MAGRQRGVIVQRSSIKISSLQNQSFINAELQRRLLPPHDTFATRPTNGTPTLVLTHHLQYDSDMRPPYAYIASFVDLNEPSVVSALRRFPASGFPGVATRHNEIKDNWKHVSVRTRRHDNGICALRYFVEQGVCVLDLRVKQA